MPPTPDDMMTAVVESLAARSVADVDDEAVRLLRLAYEQNA